MIVYNLFMWDRKINGDIFVIYNIKEGLIIMQLGCRF